MAIVSGTFPLRPFTLLLEVNLAPGGQSTVNNQSEVNWALYVRKDGNTAPHSNVTSYWSVDIDTWHGEGSFTYDYQSLPVGGISVLATGSRVLNHNPDGTRSFTYFGGANIDELGAAGTGVGTFVLPTIPRASKATFSAPAVDAGQPITINTNRASPAFTHTLEYKIGTATGTIATGVGVSQVWTPPLALLAQIPSAMSGVVTVTTKTFNGTTAIGTTTSTFTLRVPAVVLPDFTSITHAEAVALISAQVGGYVKGMSKLTLGITGETGAYGATITSYKIVVAGQTLNAKTGTTPAVIAESGPAVPIVATVTDSRGQSKTKQITVPVLNWVPPVIDPALFLLRRSNVAGTLDEDGTTIRVDLTGSVSTLIVGGVQKNKLVCRVYTRERGTVPWTLATTRNQAAGVITINGPILVSTYSIEKSWEVRVEVSDLFATATIASTVATASVLMHWDDEGVAFGKFWERGTIDALGQIYQNDGKKVVDETSLYALLAAAAAITLGGSPSAITIPGRLVNPSIAYAAAAGVFATAATVPASTGINISITFPAGRFSQPPVVVATSESGRLISATTAVTTSGATIRFDNWTPALGTPVNVRWQAIQMTAASASG